MKIIYITLLSLFLVNCLEAQSLQDFQNHYSGQTNFSNGVLTIQSSGYLNFPQGNTYPYPYRSYFWNIPGGQDRKNYEYFVWAVPSTITKIVIKANTIVNAAFHFGHGLTIEGEDRTTSIIYGTQVRDWNSQVPNDSYWLSMINKVTGYNNAIVKNLTILNPKVYCISALQGNDNNNGKLDVINCNLVDDRGGTISNSDGVDLTKESTIENCYFQLGDDNIKIIRQGTIYVNNCTFNMEANSCPFNIGYYSNYSNGANMVANNIKVIGDSGRWPDNPIIFGGAWTDFSGSSNVGITINGFECTNPNASLIDIEPSNQYLNGSISNAKFAFNNYYANGSVNQSNLTICNPGQYSISNCFSGGNMGSTVNAYSIPDFAKIFICQNSGSNSYGTFSQVVAGNPNATYWNCDQGYYPDGYPVCGYDCEHCGYDDICDGIIDSCQDDLFIIDNISGITNYSVVDEITANNTITSSGEAVYKAGNKIRLFPGFKALTNCNFRAYISPCTNALISPIGDNHDHANLENRNSLSLKDLNSSPDNAINLQVFPNPFVDNAAISYQLPESGHVLLTLIDYMGREVAVLENNIYKEKGAYQVSLDATKIPEGSYFINLITERQNISSKLLIKN